MQMLAICLPQLHFFSLRVFNDWNGLPEDIVNADSIDLKFFYCTYQCISYCTSDLYVYIRFLQAFAFLPVFSVIIIIICNDIVCKL